MSRTLAREVAMKLAFSRLLGGEGDYAQLLRLSGVKQKANESDEAFATFLLNGIETNREQIDVLITEFSSGWKLDRIAKVDLCILRIAIYELLYCDDIPQSVSINEAVEIAKTFGGDKSSSYINGVLGGLTRKLSENSEKA